MLRLMLVSLSACAVAGPLDPPPPPLSLHDRLSDGPLRFALAGTGSVEAEHRAMGDHWVGGGAGITVSTGALIVHLEGARLVADSFDVSLDPIALPESVFDQPASLTAVRVTLASSSGALPTWTSGDVTAGFDLRLDLAWSITIAGGSTALGVQHLPTIPMELELTGTGSGVDASLYLKGTGELWSWATLVRLSNLALSLAATSRFE
ncbi:hypothetical protein BH11MYX1_BH11MYX1_35930 [soil metagenome]